MVHGLNNPFDDCFANFISDNLDTCLQDLAM